MSSSPAFHSRSGESPSTTPRAWAVTPTVTCCCTPSPTHCWERSAHPILAELFPPTDPQWKGADSGVFLDEALKRTQAAGYTIGNVDSSLIMLAPKIGPHAGTIRGHVAKLLGIPVDCVGLKAKTPEGIGTDGAAIANAVVLLEQTQTTPKKPTLKAPKK